MESTTYATLAVAFPFVVEEKVANTAWLHSNCLAAGGTRLHLRQAWSALREAPGLGDQLRGAGLLAMAGRR